MLLRSQIHNRGKKSIVLTPVFPLPCTGRSFTLGLKYWFRWTEGLILSDRVLYPARISDLRSFLQPTVSGPHFMSPLGSYLTQQPGNHLGHLILRNRHTFTTRYRKFLTIHPINCLLSIKREQQQEQRIILRLRIEKRYRYDLHKTFWLDN